MNTLSAYVDIANHLAAKTGVHFVFFSMLAYYMQTCRYA